MIRFVSIVAALALSACVAPVVTSQKIALSDGQIRAIKSVTSYNLKDPSSAQFRNIRQAKLTRQDGSEELLVCGEINAKNSFGAYVGFRTFKGNIDGTNFRLHGIGNSDDNWLYVATCPT